MPRLTLRDHQRDHVGATAEGSTLLEAAGALGARLFHECGGLARCSTCRVVVLAGEDGLSPRTPAEAVIAEAKKWPNNIRLACQARILGDVVARSLVTDEMDLRLIHSEVEAGAGPASERAVAVMFCDVVGFSQFAAANLPYDVIHLLNRYFRIVGEAVLANDGILNNYIGDGLLAFFGMEVSMPENDCANAVRAALHALNEVDELKKSALRDFGFEFDVRIGIHHGPAIVGSVGHPSKLQLTALGDTVNIASRIEEANKRYGTRLLVSGEVAALIGEGLTTRQQLRARLRGQRRFHALHEVTGLAFVDRSVLVRDIFARLAPDADEFARTFYRHLFRLDPSLRDLFPAGDMQEQRHVLMRMIGVAVEHADRMLQLGPTLSALGRRHAAYGVKAAHYVTGGEALVAALNDHFSDEFTDAHRSAWQHFFTAVARSMAAAGT